MKSLQKSLDGLPVVTFRQPKDWQVWLDRNHTKSSGVWLRLAKKAAGFKSVSYAEALEVALCYGWIDGQKRSDDEVWWLQKFTPRGARSGWSKINRRKAEELIRSGKMKPAGLEAVKRAKDKGQWEQAYDSQSRATVPGDLQAELDRHPKAKAFFETLNSANRYAILYRIQTAKKAETRTKRIEQFIRMLEQGKKLHP